MTNTDEVYVTEQGLEDMKKELAHDLQIGEPVAEILYLTLHGLQRKAVLLDLQ